MDSLSIAVERARAMGISYGQYQARLWLEKQKSATPTNNPQPQPQRKPPKRAKRYRDEEAFELWQQGKTDSEIAKHFGVSRTIIQRWRDVVELPSTTKENVDTKKYRLEKTPGGEYYAIKIDTID